MTVESRQADAARAALQEVVAIDLDVCGIETGHRPTSQAFLAKSRSMLDGCGIETSLPCGEAYPR